MKKNILWILAAIMTCSIGLVSCDKDDSPSNENETENTGKPGTSGRSYDLNPKVVEVREVTGLESVLEGALAITFKQIVVEYTSVGPDLKTPVRLTGTINMTPAVYAKKNKARCLNIYNQYTTAKHRERITQDLLDDVAFFVNDYQDQIVLSADLYGWTLTEDKPQAFCCGEITAVETLDFYDAALQVLTAQGYNLQGLPLFNTGYSAGGYSTMAVQRFVDQERPDVHFALTAAGGAPFDINAIYRNQVETNSTGYVCSLPLMVVAYKETFNLAFDYSDVFQKPLCDNIQSWILSKDFGTWEINERIGIGKSVDQILTPAACDFNSPLSQLLSQEFRKNSLCGEGQTWQPSTATKFFIFHSSNDTYMDWHVGEEMANYLKAKGCTVESDFQDAGDHVLYGGIVFTLETLLHIENIIDPSATHFNDYIDGIFDDLEELGEDIDTGSYV